MKVVQVIPEFGIGGAETMCENLSLALVREGVDVVAVSLYDYHSLITERMEKNGIPVVYLNKKKGLDLGVIIRLAKLLKTIKPDVVHTHLYSLKYAYFAAKIAGVETVVHTMHNIAQKESTPKNRKLNRFFFRYCGVIPVALSENIKNTIEEEYGLTSNSIPVIYNGVDLTKCRRKENSILHDPIKIIHVGRFSEQKNHIGLINEFCSFHNLYKNSVLLLVGNGELQDTIYNATEKRGLGNCVQFLGTRDDVYNLMNESDIFVLPSLYEGVPMTIIEAMGTGLPVIASAVGGVPNMIDDKKDGFLIQNNEGELFQALQQIAENDYLRQSISDNAIIKSTLFSDVQMARNYIAVYKKEKDRVIQ